jgi:hypothetical protein
LTSFLRRLTGKPAAGRMILMARTIKISVSVAIADTIFHLYYYDEVAAKNQDEILTKLKKYDPFPLSIFHKAG